MFFFDFYLFYIKLILPLFPHMGAGGNLLHYHVETHLANET
jgi:hypothetical protein